MYGYIEIYEFPIINNNRDLYIKSITYKNNERINGKCVYTTTSLSSCDPLNIIYSNMSDLNDINISLLDNTKYFYNLIKYIIKLPEYNFTTQNKQYIPIIQYNDMLYKTKEFTTFLLNYNSLNKINNMSHFIEKIHVNKKAKIIFFGDFHGSLHTLIRSLLRLKILGYINENFILSDNIYIVFLGDIIDRGIYGCELLYIIMDLKIKNKNNVFMCKGNHESGDISIKYGFLNEISEKYKDADNILYNNIINSWNLLPNAFFLTYDNVKYIQLCHGGFCKELPKIKQFLKSNKNHCEISISNADDFLWSDYICGNQMENNNEEYGKHNIHRNIGRIYTTGESLRYLNDSEHLLGIIRGHQDMFHNSKIILNDANICTNLNEIRENQPIDWKKIIIYEKTMFDMPHNTINSTKFIIHQKLLDNKLPPIFTFSTATSSRSINNDSFGILIFSDNIKQKYIKYKNKYLNLKNKKN
jgi:hypothetical protein